jgi:hypothetical protein
MLPRLVPSVGKLWLASGRWIARASKRRDPITGRRLTPAKRDMVVVRVEWLEAAGTVQHAKGTLDRLSLREARTFV